MTDEEIRKAAAEQLEQERRGLGDIAETTPAVITSAVQSFASSLSASPALEIPVVSDPCGRYGWCSDGVRLKVDADGGAPAYGWTIWEWAPALLTAEFHCVWRSPAGELQDITPKPRSEATIVFVEDSAYLADFDFDQRPSNRRLRIYEAADRAALVRELEQNLGSGQRAYEERRAAKAGLTLQDWLDRKIPLDLLPAAIDELIDACKLFEEHFDTLGSSGLVVPDRKLGELAIRRLEAQTRLLPLMNERLRNS